MDGAALLSPQTQNYSPGQVVALESVMDWLATPEERRPQIFRLFGYAGTGKTTIAKTIAAACRGHVVFMAFTGKAALQMRRSGCHGAATIHSTIYQPVDGKDGSVTYVINKESDCVGASLIVIDECSMVGEELAKDILSFGRPVLVLGDPAQLPPVSSAGYFTEADPDAMLTEIHRQAEGNPIIALATMIRQGDVPQTWDRGGAVRMVPRGTLTAQEVVQADQVIVGTHTLRNGFNKRIRRTLGRSGPAPEIGDRLLCLKNDKSMGIFNGGLFSVREMLHRKRGSNKFRMKLVDDDNAKRGAFITSVRQEFFLGGAEDLHWKDLKHSQQFDYGYAMTCHKAQGSQWRHVIVYDESDLFRDDAHRWLYTAVTRAQKRLTLVAD
ncbi:ATP-dependent DNA helicase [Mangrovicoccus algicola]|uniref:AAA family ATPase n=1 Tax=Mangrovicoccus algicola TaxID=2771008 RepID=A0A8J6YQ02_9RHOB|nr:ATP-dependent RecD-like DNA helicase [Mangrovicoccus algicola]MBE3637368.1 AAA family ATPase [Mangrovicoccus algicola]